MTHRAVRLPSLPVLVQAMPVAKTTPTLPPDRRRLMHQERDLQPARADYDDAGAAAPGAADAACVTPQMRCIVTSWLSEVAAEFRLQQETLFLGVRLLDRFQAASPAVRAPG